VKILVKKIIQRRRMMRYFIEAVQKIIEEEGIEEVNIRKVSDIAGYNSATIYNYFNDFDHLMFFSSIKYLKEYILNLPNCIRNSKDSKERYLAIWSCFCRYSFLKPKIYYEIFFNKYNSMVNEAMKEYYTIFSEELETFPESLKPMLLNQDLKSRNLIILKPCIEEGFVKKDSVDAINEITIFTYHGMLLQAINGNFNTEIIKTTVDYIEKIIEL